MPDDPVYSFGKFALEPRERRLLHDGKSISLTPKVFDTLVLLVERAGGVVSKDELMKAIWPRGYVDESNLVKHVWTIRRALGDPGDGQGFIETVPKVGYRFIAPVTVAERRAPGIAAVPTPPQATAVTEPASEVASVEQAGADVTQHQPARAPAGGRLPQPAGFRLRRHAVSVWAAAALVLLGTAVGLRFARTPGLHAPSAGIRLALIPFDNRSADPQVAWLAPALREMLGTELAAAAEVQVVPADLVADATRDLEASGAHGFPAPALARLRSRLDADYVISGNYLAGVTTDEHGVRCEVVLQNARTGQLVTTVSNQGDVASLRKLVAFIGSQLRTGLGAAGLPAAAVTRLANAQPPTTSIARHIGVSLDALEHYDVARARDELLEAVAEAPDYAPAHAYLAQAWSALGYQQKALAAAEQAARTAAALPRENQLGIVASLHAARFQWQDAAAAYRELVSLKPHVVEYRLQLVSALTAAGSPTAAQAALTELRKLPQATDDPRITLAAADLANQAASPKDGLKYAEQALREAKRRDAPGQIANAEYSVASDRWHLGELDEAQALAAAAINRYHALGNPSGEARGRLLLAGVLTDLHRNSEASAENQHAMSLFQATGNLRGVAGVYQHLGEVLWASGDRDGAEVATRHALQMGQELGDLALQAWTLRALATIATDEAATDEAMDQYREANQLDERVGGPAAAAYGLAIYADAARLRGDLRDASETCQRARGSATRATDPQIGLIVALTCAEVALDRGETSVASGALQQVMETATRLPGFEVYRGNAAMGLAQIEMDAHQWTQARTHLELANSAFVAMASQTGEANAQAMIALCYQAMGDTAARDRAIARARTLRAAITSKQEVYALEIAIAQVASDADPRARVRALRALATDAQARHWLAWALEADLGAWRVLLHDHQTAAAQVLRGEIELQARAHGCGRILALLRAPSTV